MSFVIQNIRFDGIPGEEANKMELCLFLDMFVYFFMNYDHTEENPIDVLNAATRAVCPGHLWKISQSNTP